MIEDSVGPTSLEEAGRQAFPAFQLQTFSETTSTQDVVRAAARSGAAAGFCCMASFQTAGRGRQDRSWTAPPGSALLASVLVRVGAASVSGVPIAAGLALRQAIEATCGCDCRVKWPNDLVAAGGKVAGILCEVEPGAPGPGTCVAVGLGVNLTVPAFPADVGGVSLHRLVGTPPSPHGLLAATLVELAPRLAMLSDAGLGPLQGEWMAHATGIGSTVTVSSAGGRVAGVCEGIDGDGALILRGPDGPTRVIAGDVHLVADKPRP